jgi:hypothetical protein
MTDLVKRNQSPHQQVVVAQQIAETAKVASVLRGVVLAIRVVVDSIEAIVLSVKNAAHGWVMLLFGPSAMPWSTPSWL